jgi:hypothetical protein
VKTAGWVLLACLLVAAPAHAEAPYRVVVVTPEVDAEVSARLRAELTALGFEVVEGELDVAAPSLDELAKSREAAFAVELTPSDGGYEVTLRDRVTNKTLLREVVGGARPAEIALRAVELLRASLLELRAVHGVEGDVPSDPRLAAIAEQTMPPPKPAARPRRSPRPKHDEPEPERVYGTLGGAGLWRYDGGGSGSAFGLEASGGWFMIRALQARVAARFETPASAIETPEGNVSFRAGQLGVSLAYHFLDPVGTVSPFAEAGVHFTWLHVEGSASAPRMRGNVDDVFTTVPFLAAGVVLGARSAILRGRAALGVGFAVPAHDVAVAGEVVETWGAPLAYATVGVEVQLR